MEKRIRLARFLQLIFVLIFICSSVILISNIWRGYTEQQAFIRLSNLVSETTVELPEKAEQSPAILPKYAQAYRENSDIFGWISISDTAVDYPVMYTPDDPEHYLRTAFDGTYAVTAEHLQAYFDSLCVDGTFPDGSVSKALTIGTIHVYASVLRNAFRFAVFPKRLITFNPMQYVVLRNKTDDYEMFVDSEQAELVSSAPIVSQEQFQKITESLKRKNNPALLPIQIAYYTGLRIGEVCALTWQDIDLKEQYLTVRRSVSYNNTRHKTEIGPTKRKKIRTVDFCDTLAEILKKAKIEQQHNRKQYGELHSNNYYIEVVEKSRSYFELYSLGQPDVVPEGYKELSLVCTKPDGSYESVRAVTSITKSTAKKVTGIEDFHFHLFRHTYTSNLLSRGATPKDVQELLGHSDVSTTMNIYAHATRDSKKASARLLDQSTVSS